MTKTISRILVPHDGSEGSLAAVRFAADLAEATGATTRVLFVYDPPSEAFIGIMRLVRSELERAAADLARQHLESAQRIFETRGLKVEAVHRLGHPVDEILKEAQREQVDHIVVGSRGVGRFESLLGSVSTQITHHAKCPVTIVRGVP